MHQRHRAPAPHLQGGRWGHETGLSRNSTEVCGGRVGSFRSSCRLLGVAPLCYWGDQNPNSVSNFLSRCKLHSLQPPTLTPSRPRRSTSRPSWLRRYGGMLLTVEKERLGCVLALVRGHSRYFASLCRLFCQHDCISTHLILCESQGGRWGESHAAHAEQVPASPQFQVCMWKQVGYSQGSYRHQLLHKVVCFHASLMCPFCNAG